MQSRDDLAVFISLVAAVTILASASIAMWVWSSLSENMVTVTVERGSDRVLPRFDGHLAKAQHEPGGCHDTTAELFSGVQA